MIQFKVRKRFLIPLLLIFAMGYIIAVLSDDVEVRYVYKICPVFVIYSEMDVELAGLSKGILVFIDESARDDDSVINHELIHAKQSYRYGFQNWLAFFSERMTVELEAEAYVLDIPCKDNCDIWAKLIQEEYAPSVPLLYIEERLHHYWDERNS